jgi:hypothetical protein
MIPICIIWRLLSGAFARPPGISAPVAAQHLRSSPQRGGVRPLDDSGRNTPRCCTRRRSRDDGNRRAEQRTDAIAALVRGRFATALTARTPKAATWFHPLQPDCEYTLAHEYGDAITMADPRFSHLDPHLTGAERTAIDL